MSETHPILSLLRASKQYPARSRRASPVCALDDVTLCLRPGEAMGLVGESGSGKSTLVRCLLLLTPLSSGEVVYRDERGEMRFAEYPRGRVLGYRRAVQVVMQNPYEAFDPHQRISAILDEPLQVHGFGDRNERERRSLSAMEAVRLDPALGERYPHELSGGQLQRVAIARALSLEPRVLVLDEAVTALDASVRLEILNVLRDLRRRLGLALLFVSHDLAATSYLCERIAVMYAGRLVEFLDRRRIFASRHPYTRALVSAATPAGETASGGRRRILSGETPDPAALPTGCRFHPRCAYAEERCRSEEPVLTVVARGSGERCACHFHDSLEFDHGDGREAG